MTVRFDPILGLGTLTSEAQSALGRVDFSIRHVVDTLSQSEGGLAQRVLQLLHQNTALAKALRDTGVIGGKPTAEQGLAAVLALVLPGKDESWSASNIAMVSRLVELGAEGQELAALVVGAMHRSRGLPSNVERQAGIWQLLGARVPASRRAELRTLLLEPASSPLAPIEIKVVSKARPPRAANRIMLGLSYGGGDVFGRLAEIMDRTPASALTRALREPGRGTIGDGHAELGARLLRTLDRFRQPHDPEQIDLARFAAAFGADGVAIADALAVIADRPPLAKANLRFLAQVVDGLAALLGPRQALPLVDRLVRNDALIPKRVAAVDEALRMIPDQHFRGRGLIGVQHLFATIIPLLEGLEKKGMRPDDVHLLGTTYASNPLVVAYGRLKGFRIQPGQERAGATRSFEAHRLTEVVGFVASTAFIARIPERGFLALDDGGMLHGVLAQARVDPLGIVKTQGVSELIQRLAGSVKRGVEQTTRGLTELETINPDYGVVTVANAPSKGAEGKVIGWDLASGLLRELHWRGKAESMAKVGLVSAGTVGLELAGFLSDDLQLDVQIADVDKTKRDRAEAKGFVARATVPELAGAELLYACTGRRSVDGNIVRSFKGDIASGSSAAIELDSDHLATYGVETDVYNWGRPLNFAGDGHETLSAQQIGLTRALLLLALAQDVPQETKGAVPLGDAQYRILDFWRDTGGDRVEPLTRAAKAPPSRPDRLASTTSHDEWMTYFRNLQGRVWPTPTTTRYAAMTYCFQSPGDRPRIVNTEIGRSFELPFDDMPDRLVYTRLPAEEGTIYAVRGRGIDARLDELHLGADAVSLVRSTPIGPQAASRADTGLGADFGVDLSIAFAVEDQLLLCRGGEQLRLPCPRATELRFLWPSPSELLAIDPQSGRVSVLPVPGMPAGAWRNFRGPIELSRVDGVTQMLSPKLGAHDPVLVGAGADGLSVVALLDPQGSNVVTLPEGSTYRGLSRHNPDADPAVYRVHYSLPGDRDELELHHHVLLSTRG